MSTDILYGLKKSLSDGDPCMLTNIQMQRPETTMKYMLKSFKIQALSNSWHQGHPWWILTDLTSILK